MVNIGVARQSFICARKIGLCIMLFFLLAFTIIYSVEPWPGITKHKKSEFNNFLHTGFAFDAVITNAIFSLNIETPIIALIEYDIVFNDKIVLPKGTKIIGASSIIKSDNRVNVIFKTAIFSDGSEIMESRHTSTSASSDLDRSCVSSWS
mgnify:CR=1 FL=1